MMKPSFYVPVFIRQLEDRPSIEVDLLRPRLGFGLYLGPGKDGRLNGPLITTRMETFEEVCSYCIRKINNVLVRRETHQNLKLKLLNHPRPQYHPQTHNQNLNAIKEIEDSA